MPKWTTQEICDEIVAKRAVAAAARRAVVLSWVFVTLSLVGNIGVVNQQPWGMGCWVVANVGWVCHHIRRKDYASVALFSAYLCLSVWGLISWANKS